MGKRARKTDRVRRSNLDEIVNDALDLDPSEWPRFLASRCRGRPALKAAAESLLSLHREHPHLLALPDRATTSPRALLGRYRIVREVGHGGSSAVYEAEDPRSRRTVAIKLLPPHLARDDPWKIQFRREARLLGSLDHAHIARVHTIEESDGVSFLTMELLKGGTLEDRLSAGALSLGDALTVGRQIASAIEAMHQAGILHCDLKPSNVVFGEGGVAKVVDLGIARKSENITGASGRQRISGTPGYMSPEQVRGQTLGPAVDAFALGCILYECLAGRPAFRAGSVTGRMRAVLEREPNWNDVPAGTPARLVEVLQRCLRKQPEDRLSDLRLVRRELDAALSNLDVTSSSRALESREASPPTNLSERLGSLVGRRSEREQVRRYLARVRLVTLTGMGGTGKTRLALTIGRDLLDGFPDGVWFVDLSPLRVPEQVGAAVAAALGVRQNPTQALDASIREHVADRKLLLILDNCEHLIRASAQLVRELLDAGAGVSILATSRLPLGLADETVVPVPRLAVPLSGPSAHRADVEEIESVELFVSRARAADPSFVLTDENASVIARICVALDGLPLAVELAATAGAFSLEGIAARLLRAPCAKASREQSNHRVHTGPIARRRRGRSVAPRSRSATRRLATLAGVIGWSYRLLEPAERRLFRRLSVFPGGWTLAAAEEVCAGEEIEPWEIAGLHARLLDQSLVEMDLRSRTITAEIRYRMLATVREYARARLLRTKEPHLLHRYTAYFAQLARTGARQLTDPTLEGRDLDAERENLDHALDICTRPRGDIELGQQMLVALEAFWMNRGRWSEWGRFGAAVLRRGRKPTADRAQALNTVGNWYMYRGDLARARRYYERGLSIARSIRDPSSAARSRHNLGGVALHQGDLRSARRYFELYLAHQRRVGALATLPRPLNNLAVIAEREGDVERAQRLYRESLETSRTLGDKWMAARTLRNLGGLSIAAGDIEDARRLLEEALALSRELEDPQAVANVISYLGMAAGRKGDVETAAALFRDALLRSRDLGDLHIVATLLVQLGYVSLAYDRPEQAAQRLAASETLRNRIGSALWPAAQRQFDDHVAQCRAALGDVFAAAWREGASLSTEEAIAEALE